MPRLTTADEAEVIHHYCEQREGLEVVRGRYNLVHCVKKGGKRVWMESRSGKYKGRRVDTSLVYILQFCSDYRDSVSLRDDHNFMKKPKSTVTVKVQGFVITFWRK